MIPEENIKDLADIPENVKSGLDIVPVRWIDKVLEIALAEVPMPLPDVEAPSVTAAAVVVPDPAALPLIDPQRHH
jgi:ATP-dependent Lon protease